MQEPVPVVESARLRLRGYSHDDFAAITALWGDPAVTRHITGDPLSEEDAWARLLRAAGHWALLGFGFWAVEEKETGRFVGQIGFADFKRDLTPSFDGAPEIGWVLASWAQGQGFATEAVQAALAWGQDFFGPVRTGCMISPDNLGSIRVAEKCGFRQFASTTYKGDPVLLFERPGSRSEPQVKAGT